MNDKTYDILNKVQRWLPALGILYLTICNIWNLPYGDEVNQTIIAVATFLATTLEIANGVYLYNESRKANVINVARSTELEFFDYGEGEGEGDDLK